MDNRPPEEPVIDTSELSMALARLGLSQYAERLRNNGFDDWETVMAITETDLMELHFKLGDRRKFQRAILEYSSSSGFHGEYGASSHPLPSEGLPIMDEHSEVTSRSSQQAGPSTRPYRRHPRPDHDAPTRPKTAYVLFGEHVREDAEVNGLSFAEISKKTGKRWKELSQEQRVNVWEAPAASRLQDYKKELEQYKRTENYQSYQTYLERFKQQKDSRELIKLSDKKASSSSEFSPVGPPASSQGQGRFEDTRQESVDSGNLNSEGRLPDTASHVESGMEEVRHISKALGIDPHLIRIAAFPPEQVTTKAVEAFLHGTGLLLYLWDRDEALGLVRSVYHLRSDSRPEHATEVFAMSAVGGYCDGGADTISLQEMFLHFFLSMLSSPLDMCDLRRMRLFACLAMCRFTNSVDSARRLMCK